MRLLQVLFALTFTASISSFAQAQPQACEWRYAGGGTAPDRSWTRVEVCLTINNAPNVQLIAQRTTRSSGSCTISIEPGYTNTNDCHDANIVPTSISTQP